MGFLVPAFALFAALAAVPLVVHLYGRPRAERRRFAAIRFLIESNRKTAVQRRLRELALLCARAAAIAVVPLLLAKPYLTAPVDLAAGIGASESAVVVIDDSRSMGFSHGAASLFDDARARASRLVDGLGRDSEAAVLVTSQGAPAPQGELTADRELLRRAIAQVRLSARPGDTTAALRRAAAILSASPRAARRVYLVSDFAVAGFSSASPWSEGGPGLTVLDVGRRIGQPPADNRAVVAVRAGPAPQLGPRGVEVSAVIANFGAAPAQGVPITLRIDGRAVARGTLDVPARGRAEKRFSHVYGDAALGAAARDPGAGVHEAVVELGADALPDDDRRYLRIDERRALRVLLLDGDPRGVRRDDELFYLETALRPGDRDDSRIAVRVATPEELPQLRLDDVDVIFAANIKAPDAARAARLLAYVKEGGGLFLAVGDNVEPDAWNAALGELLPQPLQTLRTVGATRRARDDGESIEGLVPPVGDGERLARFDDHHPVLAPFQEGGGGAHGPAQALREARVGRYALLRPTPQAGDEQRRALLRLDSGAPLLVEGRTGKGRVLLLTTTVDRDWGDLAIQPGFLPLVQQASRYLARAPLAAAADDSLLGQPHEAPLAEGDARVELTLPDGTVRHYDADRVAGRATLPIADTGQVGFHRLAVATAGEREPRPRPEATFSVNLDVSESDLAPIEAQRLEALQQPAAAPEGARARRRLDLWHGLGGALLLLLLIEGLLTLPPR